MNSISEQLKRTIRLERAMHSYLITAPDLDRATELARECAALFMLKTEDTSGLRFLPDYFELEGNARIDELRVVRSEVYKQTFSSKNRVVLIKNVHLLNDNAVNAMLKMLEEPPAGTYFLLTGIEQRILPTIRSRCHTVRLGTETIENAVGLLLSMGASKYEAELYSSAGMGSEKRSLRLFEDEEYRTIRKNAINAIFEMLKGGMPFKWAKSIGKDRKAALESIEFMLSICHDIMRIINGSNIDTNIDMRIELIKDFSGFTTLKISGIIDRLVSAAMRLTTNASPNLILDELIVEVMEDLGYKNRT